jgi:putative transposase
MLQILMVQLIPNPAQDQALLTTIHTFNRAANSVAEAAFTEHTRSMVKLQKRIYGEVRSQFNLPA